ncbi:FRG domain-containing protein [Bradyrhizobium quebecense]|uniref:FRG domain-containing protein n=1 Tax=Bradyrhizobium quebecense TaxID=2748629 RepID=A0A974AFH1_9BRAD|nr:FRG domain-containing protein [Bradyrhizobium quebecense]UGA45966.1 FRG domain-containing protein [Bradyrhizobium quebecense]
MQSNDEETAKPRTTEVKLSSWEEFEERVTALDPGNERRVWDEVWFRGQADARWALETTLERRSRGTQVSDYLRVIQRIKPSVETFTGLTFDMPPYQVIEQSCRQFDLFQGFMFESATYMAHLRHGGFPSPLLDWSHSPYVAAFFAFSKARDPSHEVAIYAYREHPGIAKFGGSDEPNIFSMGPYIRTHNRHFRQQSRYTFCAQFIDGHWYFAPHDSVFKITSRLEQDLLWKFTIPASERRKVLRHFDKFNMNEYTLFASEEGLLEMLAMREIDLRE